MSKKNNEKRLRINSIYTTVICLGPPIWTLIGLFTTISEKERIVSTIATIPCLLFLGFILGIDHRDKDVFELAQEVDELESQLRELENKAKKDN
ncbi:hypothetical protein [Periweissella fabalis]|uniref:Uncharacterized protein n=1 Tax=Periweissella fabalis TaxID=1070421 RepID=A0A7X6S2S2_9LACO|nr:hypothetical protein [Periweissella fabalis]MCM0599127.1 hypothetical protein [Periweissella fabalis]NKZ23406.1 hypothetical protein [Periweissella fabalis]